MNKRILVLVWGFIVAPSLAAAEENLFQCEKDFGFVLGHCAIISRSLAADPLFRQVRFEADYDVEYSFLCRGHQPTIGVASGANFTRFELGANHAIAKVRGRDGVRTSDPRPSETLDLSYEPGCRLVVHRVTVAPSSQAIDEWVGQARSQAKVIKLSIALYLMANDFSSYRDWDLARTRDLFESIKEKIFLFEDRCRLNGGDACAAKVHFMAIGNALRQKLDGAPILPRPEELTDEAKSLVAYYEDGLKDEVRQGQFMVDRFREFQKTIEVSLTQALAAVPEGVKE